MKAFSIRVAQNVACGAAMLFALSANGPAHTVSDADSSTLPAITPQVIRMQHEMITLDTHLDTPASLDIPGWSILERHDVARDYTQVDLPRMKQGELDGGFWAIYTPQGPLDAADYHRVRDFAIMRGLSIRLMIAAAPDQFELATRAADAARINAEGKRIVFMSIENAYPLGEDPSMLEMFYKMGVRETGFAHFRNNQFADSSTDPDGPRWNGLSPLGFKLLGQANRLGVIVDGSHSSDAVLDQLIRYSTTPVVLSHSGCKAVFDHPRNVDDARLKALAAKGGVIQINSYGGYLHAAKANPQRAAAMKQMFAMMHEDRAMTAAEHDAFLARRRAIDARFPDTDPATLLLSTNSWPNALKVVGPDHVGIGMDWDGGGGVQGLEDASKLPRITAALLAAGYSKADIAKIWGGNILRVMRAVEAARTTTS